VLIENKIFAAVANPFKDYAEYLDNLKNENGEAYAEDKKTKVLLTLYPSSEGAEWRFVNLTHADFASAIRSALGHHVSTADTRYLTLMLDFLNTLEHLGEGSRMNQEFVKLLAERSDEVEELLANLKEFRGELREKVQELGSLIEVEDHQNVRQLFWRSSAYLLDVLAHDIYVDEEPYAGINTVIHTWGWEIQIFPHKGGSRSELKGVLNELEIPFEDAWRLIYPTRFVYDEDPSRIAPVVQGIVDRISRSVG